VSLLHTFAASVQQHRVARFPASTTTSSSYLSSASDCPIPTDTTDTHTDTTDTTATTDTTDTTDTADTTGFRDPFISCSDYVVTSRRLFDPIFAASRAPPTHASPVSVSVMEPYDENAAALWPAEAGAPLVLHADYDHEALCAALLAARATRCVPFISLDELRSELPRHLGAESQLRFLPSHFDMRSLVFAVFWSGFSVCCVNLNTADSPLTLPNTSDVYVLLTGGVGSSALVLADACLRASVDRLLRAPPLLRRHAADAASALASRAPASFAAERTLLTAHCVFLLQWWAMQQICSGTTLVGAALPDDSDLVARATKALRGAGYRLAPERVHSLLRVLLALADCFARQPFSSLNSDQLALLDALLERDLQTAGDQQQHHRTVESAALRHVVLPALRHYYLTRTDNAAHARRHTDDDYASAEATLSGAVDYVQATTGVVVSRSYLYRRLLPRVPDSHEARRHIIEIRVRPAAPVKVAIDRAIDSHYCAALVRLRRFAFGSLPFGRDITAPTDGIATFFPHALTIARDDKARVHLTNSPVLRPQVREGVYVLIVFLIFFLFIFSLTFASFPQRVTVLVDSNGVRHPPQLGISDYEQTNANSIIAQGMHPLSRFACTRVFVVARPTHATLTAVPGVLVLRCVDQQPLADNAARNSGQSLYMLRHGAEGQSAAQHCAELLALISRQPQQFMRHGELVRALLIISDGGPYVGVLPFFFFFFFLNVY
jgi:hypothetical protein